MRAPYLEREEEHRLAVRWKELHDQEALHRITSAHMRLVIALAARFRHYLELNPPSDDFRENARHWLASHAAILK